MKKKIFTLFASLMMCIAMFGWDGSGTSTEPYLIQSAEDLKTLATNVNGGNNYSGIFFKMTSDIDLTNEEWMPIGNATTKFQGKFDGNDFVVRNLVINQTSETEVQGVGLFGFVLQAEIKNLGLQTATVNIGFANSVGALIGVLKMPHNTKSKKKNDL